MRTCVCYNRRGQEAGQPGKELTSLTKEDLYRIVVAASLSFIVQRLIEWLSYLTMFLLSR